MDTVEKNEFDKNQIHQLNYNELDTINVNITTTTTTTTTINNNNKNENDIKQEIKIINGKNSNILNKKK